MVLDKKTSAEVSLSIASSSRDKRKEHEYMTGCDTIQSVLAFRLLFFWQRAKSFRFDEQHFHVCAKGGDERHDLLKITLRESSMGFGLRILRLTGPGGAYSLYGVQAKESTAFLNEFENAVQLAKRMQLVMQKWTEFQEVFDRWSGLELSDRYITESDLQDWRKQSGVLDLPNNEAEAFCLALPPEKQMIFGKLWKLWHNSREEVDSRNAKYAKEECERYGELFNTVEKNPLSDEQRAAIVHDEDNSLVIAGAGCGKTSTIIGKVGYIHKKGMAAADEVLLLAFTTTAAREMRERIRQILPGFPVQVRTFHSLGMEIIKQASGKKPSVCKSSKDPKWKSMLLNGILADLCSDTKYLAKLAEYMGSIEKPYKSLWDFKNENDYRNYLLDVEPRTLQGELTASYEECEIANWLTLHNVRYEYEMAYRYNQGSIVDTAKLEHRQYMPDFYLPDHKIYIEHRGVDREGRAAPFMDNERYQETMEWSRKIHAENGTTLIETYSWERMGGILLPELKRKLTENGVDLGRLSVAQAIENLREKGRVSSLVNLLGSFMSLMKAGNMNMAELRHKIDSTSKDKRQHLFLDLFEGVYEKYQEKLLADGQIDFDYMIAGALKAVQLDEYAPRFRYIIIDEFQDIGKGRADLIMTLRNKVAGSKLFCVGDDWQSIYRFTGSDISLMTQFKAHFGYTHETRLTKTYRFNDRIAEFSTRFVLKNKAQIFKVMVTEEAPEEPQVLIHWRNIGRDPVFDILKVINSLGQAKVLILKRYNLHIDLWRVREYQAEFNLLEIEALTVHKSKGLEADYVIIDNLCGGILGFPSGICDDPVLNLVLPVPDSFPHGEERRLFYVSLTRAKKRVHLIADEENESSFVREILNEAGSTYDLGAWPSEIDSSRAKRPPSSYPCPQCGRGHIRKLRGPEGGFFVCSNRPICGWEALICPKCGDGALTRLRDSVGECHICGHRARICPQCGKGVLVDRRNNRDGNVFLGCSKWRPGPDACKYTERIEQS